MYRTTAKAPVNIAVIKYWGKRDENLILPVNDSISVTLSKEFMCATTTIASSPKFEEDRIWLNGIEQSMENQRLKNCLREIKLRASKCKNSALLQWPVHICSENNFPTAAGLASSAAGYACLVSALGSLYDVKDDLSIIARQGSGSACRSIFGGFVQWHKGEKLDGSDSFASQIAAKSHWPELRAIILVVNSKEKATSSTNGMKLSIDTSEFMSYRANEVVPKRIRDISNAILERDFHTFAEITMKDSNQFHAVCLDTYPPIRYMNSTSFKIVDFVHAYNEFYGANKVSYTFDAGPNACLYLLEKDVPEVMGLILKAFPSEKTNYIRGLIPQEIRISEELIKVLKIESCPEELQFIINTKVGDGPQILEDESLHLLDEHGLPKK